MSTSDRALAAFRGLALGDALGMPTQSMSRAEILADHGPITGLLDAGPRQRIAAGMAAGSITDDTEQAVLLAELLVEGDGVVDPVELARRLLAWETRMRERGSLDLLGPSTKAALARLEAGVPADEAGRTGATNGAAMRITPVGIAADASDLKSFVDVVARTSAPTHNTGLGIAAAAAVGAAVSAGVGGASLPEAVEVAIAAADEGGRRGYWVAGGSIAARLRWALPHLASLRPADRETALIDVVGTSVAAQESVVAALALAALADDPWDALCQAAGLGGDTDTIAAMAGAVLGATHGGSVWPTDAIATVEKVNDLALAPLVTKLLALRGRP
ncbi:ADP-ribosylglycohydrolase family protein [Lentzea cavernae]|uniref:ADP-ribosylglycohydrolase n=1 Tax=Lentzea cavernae TaxID=2020703 RepID=A0ABQ3M6U6_9PSEU|nr:ADP-ribosylglycohydrolase family protein [Lentzea cavernae]GHH35044.1 ADP-ribosylglycohydrolase [Lentzea cavernae]